MSEKVSERRTRRVFINNIDSFASRNIAKLLSQCAPAEADGATEAEEGTGRTDRAFEVVGTVCEPLDEDSRSYVLEEYSHLSRDVLLSKLLDCDVVVYNITQHADQLEEALWAVSALHKETANFSGPKMFILVSTVMTWARTKSLDYDDLELPFTDEIFWMRKAHPNFRAHIDLEKRVVQMGKTNRKLFSTYVVASGLQYGMGEQVLHYFFKTSWLGRQQEIPVFGDGKNIVPMIHINDLASVIQNVIEHQPRPYYLLAVDSSKNTLEDIVKGIAKVLGRGKTRKESSEEAFLIRDLSAMDVDSLLVNLRMKAVHLKELFSIDWVCESGLLENIDLVVEEYRRTRGLLPICVCVLGPPAVGKSTVSRLLCQHYRLHHVTLKETISETITFLENAVKDNDPDSENTAAESRELLDTLMENMEQKGGVLDDQLLVKLVKDKLTSKPCRNQGFVLDGFPETLEQAKELFYDQGHDDDEVSSTGTYHERIMPELVLYLDASDSYLKDRVMNLPERIVQEQHYEQDHFLRRLAHYRDSNNMADATVVNYFDDLDINTLFLEVTGSEEPDCFPLMQKVLDTVGKPRNYGPSIQEAEEEESAKAEERMKREARERAEEERREQEEARTRAQRWQEWSQALEAVRQQEAELLEEQSAPMRSYLTEHVMPTLTQGLVQCCSERPQDPVDFLAEYLIKNNPFNY